LLKLAVVREEKLPIIRALVMTTICLILMQPLKTGKFEGNCIKDVE